MTNKSGLAPLGRAVLVKHYEDPNVGKGMIVLPDSVKERGLLLDQKVMVIEVGPACWPDEAPRAKPGDIVLISKMSGYFAKGDDGEFYRLINDRDIFAAVKETNHE